MDGSVKYISSVAAFNMVAGTTPVATWAGPIITDESTGSHEQYDYFLNLLENSP